LSSENGQNNLNDQRDSAPAAVPVAKLERSRASGGLVYDPVIRAVSQSFYRICGRMEVPGAIPWGFWGGMLVAFVAILLIADSRSVYQIWDILWALVALSVGVAMFRFGRRSSRREVILCELDLERETLSWPGQSAANSTILTNSAGSSPQPATGELVLGFEEISELVFAMIDFPLSTKRNDVDVHAFTLLVRDASERLVPVVEATPNKEEAHEIAKVLSRQLGLNISYVGKGFQ
jgi:hypothetical protein